MSGSSGSASGREATHWLPLLLKEHIIHKQCYNQLSEGCQGTLKINNVNKTNKLHESARSQSFAFVVLGLGIWFLSSSSSSSLTPQITNNELNGRCHQPIRDWFCCLLWPALGNQSIAVLSLYYSYVCGFPLYQSWACVNLSTRVIPPPLPSPSGPPWTRPSRPSLTHQTPADDTLQQGIWAWAERYHDHILTEMRQAAGGRTVSKTTARVVTMTTTRVTRMMVMRTMTEIPKKTLPICRRHRQQR